MSAGVSLEVQLESVAKRWAFHNSLGQAEPGIYRERHGAFTELWLCTCGATIARIPCRVNQYHQIKMGCMGCQSAARDGMLRFGTPWGDKWRMAKTLMADAMAHAVWWEARGRAEWEEKRVHA